MNPFLRGAERPVPVLNIAHRGARTVAPENTLVAFAEALRRGAHMIECDVRFTVDEIPILHHDASLDRMTDVARRHPDRAPYRVRDFSADEIAELEAGGGARVPLLRDALHWARDSGMYLNVEVKSASRSQIEKVVTVIGSAGMTERVILSSFDHEAVHRAKRHQPRLATAVLSGNRLIDPIRYVVELVGADAYHPGCAGEYDALDVSGGLDRDLFKRATQAGVAINPWTVNDPPTMRMLIDAGVSGIVTDDPAVLARVLGGSAP